MMRLHRPLEVRTQQAPTRPLRQPCKLSSAPTQTMRSLQAGPGAHGRTLQRTAPQLPAAPAHPRFAHFGAPSGNLAIEERPTRIWCPFFWHQCMYRLHLHAASCEGAMSRVTLMHCYSTGQTPTSTRCPLLGRCQQFYGELQIT